MSKTANTISVRSYNDKKAISRVLKSDSNNVEKWNVVANLFDMFFRCLAEETVLQAGILMK